MTIFVAYILGTYIIKMKNSKCPAPKIVYKPYVRTFIEEQEDPSYVMTLFKTMFHGNNPWFDTKVQSTYTKVGRQQPMAYGGRPKNKMVGQNTSRDDYLGTFFG